MQIFEKFKNDLIKTVKKDNLNDKEQNVENIENIDIIILCGSFTSPECPYTDKYINTFSIY